MGAILQRNLLYYQVMKLLSNKFRNRTRIQEPDPVGSSGIQWEPVGFRGIQRDPEGSSLNQLVPVGSSGIQLDPVGSIESQWDPVGSSCIQLNPEGSIWICNMLPDLNLTLMSILIQNDVDLQKCLILFPTHCRRFQNLNRTEPEPMQRMSKEVFIILYTFILPELERSNWKCRI